MVLIGTACVALLLITTVIHYEILRVLSGSLSTLDMPTRAKLIVVIFGTFFAHAAEIFLYAVPIYLTLPPAFGRGTIAPAL